MKDPDIVAQLSDFIREKGEVEPDDVDFSPTADLFDYGYLDSFGIVELIAMVQQRYGVDMTNTDFYGDDIRTIERIAAHIASRVNGRGSPPDA